jgi:hypothetical protein
VEQRRTGTRIRPWHFQTHRPTFCRVTVFRKKIIVWKHRIHFIRLGNFSVWTVVIYKPIWAQALLAFATSSRWPVRPWCGEMRRMSHRNFLFRKGNWSLWLGVPVCNIISSNQLGSRTLSMSRHHYHTNPELLILGNRRLLGRSNTKLLGHRKLRSVESRKFSDGTSAARLPFKYLRPIYIVHILFIRYLRLE